MKSIIARIKYKPFSPELWPFTDEETVGVMVGGAVAAAFFLGALVGRIS